MDLILAIVLIAAALILGAAAAGAFVYRLAFNKGVEHRKKDAEAQIESAEKEAERIVSEAKEKAETTKKSKLVEAKDEIYRMRGQAEKEIQKMKSEAERELKDRRAEVSRSERRLQQKEENLDKKNDKIEKLEESLNAKNKKAEEKLAEAEKLKSDQMGILERISGFTTEQAKEHLLHMLDSELDREKAVLSLLGRNGNFAQGELDAVHRWFTTYGFSEEIIREACNRTVVNVEDHRIAYAESILRDWFNSGVSVVEDIASLDEEYRKKKAGTKPSQSGRTPAAGQAKAGKKNGTFGNFEERQDDYDLLVKKLSKK